MKSVLISGACYFLTFSMLFAKGPERLQSTVEKEYFVDEEQFNNKKYFNDKAYFRDIEYYDMAYFNDEEYADHDDRHLPHDDRHLTDKEDVVKVIHLLFEGMRKGDSAMVSAVFDKGARMATIDSRRGEPQFREGSLPRFLNAVGTPHDNVWDERIGDPVVQVDGHLATVWVNYAFYVDDQFSHCGVNAFQLFKGPEGWKIVNLTDTRREDGCKEP